MERWGDLMKRLIPCLLMVVGCSSQPMYPAATGESVSFNNFVIGARRATALTNGFVGRISEVVVFSAVTNEAGIQAELESRWPLNDDNGA